MNTGIELNVSETCMRSGPYQLGLIYNPHIVTKTCPYNVDPLKPHFYIVKVGFTGVYINFLISAQNIDCGYSLEPPCRGGSNEYPQSVFLSRNKKNIRFFYLKTFIFLVVKFSVYLNRFVFVMNFSKSRNGFNDHKEPENINYTKVKYGETFYGRHATQNLNNSLNRFSDDKGPENTNCTIVICGEIFYGRNMAEAPVVVKIDTSY